MGIINIEEKLGVRAENELSRFDRVRREHPKLSLAQAIERKLLTREDIGHAALREFYRLDKIGRGLRAMGDDEASGLMAIAVCKALGLL